jgi:NADPH:quinone reductase
VTNAHSNFENDSPPCRWCRRPRPVGKTRREAAAERLIPVALDHVGGTATTDLLSLLSPVGTVYLYGMLADTGITLDASALVTTEKSVRGISIARWLTAVAAEQRASDLASAGMLVGGLTQYLDTAAVYPIHQLNDAVRASTQTGKIGIVLVKF